MSKKRIALIGIILFAASIFPWNAEAIDPASIDPTLNNGPTNNWTKQTKQKEPSKARQGKLSSHKKTISKRKA